MIQNLNIRFHISVANAALICFKVPTRKYLPVNEALYFSERRMNLILGFKRNNVILYDCLFNNN